MRYLIGYFSFTILCADCFLMRLIVREMSWWEEPYTSGSGALHNGLVIFFSFYPCRMHRKNGQFASVKENTSTSSWDSSQTGLQDSTPRPETVWVSSLHVTRLFGNIFHDEPFDEFYLQCVLVSGDVNIVVLVKIILQQCVVAQLVQGLYVMLVGLCGQIRFV